MTHLKNNYPHRFVFNFGAKAIVLLKTHTRVSIIFNTAVNANTDSVVDN